MIGLRLSVPVACWRKAHARELFETEKVPPPATCYGALLSLVGETDRLRHQGCRITGGVIAPSPPSTVVRTLWKIKDLASPQGSGENAKPDFQQLLTNCELFVWCDSRDEQAGGLEGRVKRAFESPSEIDRFGGWSLGESTHLINEAHLLPEAIAPAGTRAFLLDDQGHSTLPIWVDHVGMAGTRYAVGNVEPINGAPPVERLPIIRANG